MTFAKYLRNNVKNISARESQPSFFARYVGIVVWVVIEICFDANFTFSLAKFSVGWDQLECDDTVGVLLEQGHETLEYFYILSQSICFTKMVKTSFGVFPSTLMLLTSITSSPTWIKPDLSAAPPCIIRAMMILPVSSSVLIVAPWWKRIFNRFVLNAQLRFIQNNGKDFSIDSLNCRMKTSEAFFAQVVKLRAHSFHTQIAFMLLVTPI